MPPSSLVPDLPGATGPHRAHRDGEGPRRALPVGRGPPRRPAAVRPRAAAGRRAQGLDVTTAAPAASTVRIPAPVEIPRPAPDPVPAAAARKQRSRWAPAIAIGIALAVLVALIVVLLVNSDFGDGGNAAPSRNVPNVNGIAYGQAEAALKALGFTVARTDVNEPETAPDVVTGQDPEGGRKLPKGGLITLTVEQRDHPVPNVVGQQRTQATQALAAEPTSPATSSSRTAISHPAPCSAAIPPRGRRWPSCRRAAGPRCRSSSPASPPSPCPTSARWIGRRPRHAHPGRVPAHHRQRRERRRTGGGRGGHRSRRRHAAAQGQRGHPADLERPQPRSRWRTSWV